jgi:hypothetical protein
MSQTVEQALAEKTLYSDRQNYEFVRLPASAITACRVIAEIGEPFCVLIVDRDESEPADACGGLRDRAASSLAARPTR